MIARLLQLATFESPDISLQDDKKVPRTLLRARHRQLLSTMGPTDLVINGKHQKIEPKRARP